MKVKIKKLHEDAVIPSYAKSGDAGVDLVSIRMEKDKNKNDIHYTGLAIEIPEGHVGLLFPRSSISKTSCALRNAVGVIDSGYRGEIMLKFSCISNLDCYKVGDRVGQLIIMPYPQVQFEEVEELSDSDRGEGGFGSTGA
jgi:dUTP pyrophosphatase